MACLNIGNWLIDIRAAEKDSDISLDVSRHIPQRLVVGPALVLTDNPRVFLSVVRKRLARLIAAVELKRCQTMDKNKRASLASQLLTLHTTRFSAKHSGRQQVDTLFISPEDLAKDLMPAQTIYLTTPLLEAQLRKILEKLEQGGLLVTYGPWPEHYQAVLSEFDMSV